MAPAFTRGKIPLFIYHYAVGPRRPTEVRIHEFIPSRLNYTAGEMRAAHVADMPTPDDHRREPQIAQDHRGAIVYNHRSLPSEQAENMIIDTPKGMTLVKPFLRVAYHEPPEGEPFIELVRTFPYPRIFHARHEELIRGAAAGTTPSARAGGRGLGAAIIVRALEHIRGIYPGDTRVVVDMREGATPAMQALHHRAGLWEGPISKTEPLRPTRDYTLDECIAGFRRVADADAARHAR